MRSLPFLTILSLKFLARINYHHFATIATYYLINISIILNCYCFDPCFLLLFSNVIIPILFSINFLFSTIVIKYIIFELL